MSMFSRAIRSRTTAAFAGLRSNVRQIGRNALSNVVNRVVGGVGRAVLGGANGATNSIFSRTPAQSRTRGSPYSARSTSGRYSRSVLGSGGI